METPVKKQFYPTIRQSFRLIIRLALISIPISIPFGIIGYLLKKYLEQKSELIESSIYLVAYILPLLIIIRLGLKRFRSINTSDYSLKFNKIPANILFISIVIALSATVIIDPLVELIPMPESFRDFMLKLAQPNIFSFLLIVIAAPILEEILFRGIILEGFLKNYPPQKAIIWSAIIFGIVHMNPWQAIGATFAGLIIGWIYYRTNSLIPGMLIHFTNNLIAFFILALSNNKAETFVEFVGGREIYLTMFGVSLIILFVGFKTLEKSLKNYWLTKLL